MLTEKDARNLADKILSYAKLPGCQISINATEDVFIRFANNGITTSGSVLNHGVSIVSETADKRSGVAVVNEWSDEALRRGVEQAEALARISRPNPESMPPLGQQKYPEIANFDRPTSDARGEVLIPHVREIIEGARSKKLIAAGFVQKTARWSAVANAAGLFGYHQATSAELTNTTRNPEGTSSGWATQVSNTIADLNGASAASITVEKCLSGAKKKRLDPGKYTVILEPSAVADLLRLMGNGFGARAAEQGQSFLSKKGSQGATLVGEKMFPEAVSLRSDPLNPRFGAMPWTGALLPNDRVVWIGNGDVRNLSYDRYWAQTAGKKPTPPPTDLVLEGQDHSLEDLIKSAGKAILVTRLWYVRMLQPQTLQATGLTRDGVFLVENGKTGDPLMNFRWNESPVRVLQRIKMMSAAVHTQGSEGAQCFAPAVLSEEFNFASISDAV